MKGGREGWSDEGREGGMGEEERDGGRNRGKPGM